MELKNEEPKYTYDAFISYSRKNTDFAAKLEKALKDYKPPKDLDVPQRHINVFRDVNDFTGADYDQSVKRHLKASAKLIVVCSPEARSSEYVNDGIRDFVAFNDPNNIVSVLLSGVPNNEAKNGDESKKAFPGALCEALGVPLAIDYRNFDAKKDKVSRGIFAGEWHRILAELYGKDRGYVEQRNKKREIRRRHVVIGIVSAIIVVLSHS
jgi:hypothetical protein